MRQPLALTAILVLTALAGCSNKGPPEAWAGADYFEDVEVDVSDTTGVILGVAVDDAIRPLAGVVVSLDRGAEKQTTDDRGRFVFDGLAAGTYRMQANLGGYSPVQATAEVQAGVRDPPVTKVQLLAEATQTAFFAAQTFTGFIMCTSNVAAVCGSPNVVSTMIVCPITGVCAGNITEDRFGSDLFYMYGADYIQSELVWNSTQQASPELTLYMQDSSDACVDDFYQNMVVGISPLVNAFTGEQVRGAGIGSVCPIFHGVYAGNTAAVPFGLAVNQKFDLFSHAFYLFTPAEGWRFSRDGDPIPPLLAS